MADQNTQWEPQYPSQDELDCPHCGRPMKAEFHDDEWLLWCTRCKDSFAVEPKNLKEKYD